MINQLPPLAPFPGTQQVLFTGVADEAFWQFGNSGDITPDSVFLFYLRSGFFSVVAHDLSVLHFIALCYMIMVNKKLRRLQE